MFYNNNNKFLSLYNNIMLKKRHSIHTKTRFCFYTELASVICRTNKKNLFAHTYNITLSVVFVFKNISRHSIQFLLH